jgi:hypothetical protein
MIDNVFLYLLVFGKGSFLFSLFIPIGTYLFWRISTVVVSKRVPKKLADNGVSVKSLLISSLITLILFLISINLATTGIVVLEGTEQTKQLSIASNNNYLMELDRKIFGTYLPLWLQSSTNQLKPIFDATSSFLIWIYLKLSAVLTITFIIIAVAKSKVAIQMYTAIIFCVFISFPFWYFFPSTSPVIGYLYPPDNTQIPDNISSALTDYNPNQTLQAFFQRRIAFDPSGPVTTIPSIHAAWATVLVYFGVIIWPPLAIIGTPYLFLNILASTFTLQHYVIDLIVGTMVGCIAIMISYRLHIERIKSVKNILDLVQEDKKEVIKQLKRMLNKIR